MSRLVPRRTTAIVSLVGRTARGQVGGDALELETASARVRSVVGGRAQA